jgi:hypothetical protein
MAVEAAGPVGEHYTGGIENLASEEPSRTRPTILVESLPPDAREQRYLEHTSDQDDPRPAAPSRLEPKWRPRMDEETLGPSTAITLLVTEGASR